jgi:excinuclease ABC subunit C
VDVFSFLEDENSAYVNFMKVCSGAIVQVHTLELQKRMDERQRIAFAHSDYEMRQRMMSTSREIIVPFEVDFGFDQVTFTIPSRGDKKNCWS